MLNTRLHRPEWITRHIVRLLLRSEQALPMTVTPTGGHKFEIRDKVYRSARQP